MNPKETLINLFAALAITVIAQPIAQAHAGDFFEDLFSGGQPEVTTFDQVRTACQQANPGKNADAMERAIRCTAARSAGFSAFQLNLIKYDLELVKQIKAGQLQYADFQPYEAAWMSEYRQNYNEQRRLANAVENIPLQQAMWANTIAGINQAGQSYTPRMFINSYR
jgi:hypothetical protein